MHFFCFKNQDFWLKLHFFYLSAQCADFGVPTLMQQPHASILRSSVDNLLSQHPMMVIYFQIFFKVIVFPKGTTTTYAVFPHILISAKFCCLKMFRKIPKKIGIVFSYKYVKHFFSCKRNRINFFKWIWTVGCHHNYIEFLYSCNL